MVDVELGRLPRAEITIYRSGDLQFLGAKTCCCENVFEIGLEKARMEEPGGETNSNLNDN